MGAVASLFCSQAVFVIRCLSAWPHLLPLAIYGLCSCSLFCSSIGRWSATGYVKKARTFHRQARSHTTARSSVFWFRPAQSPLIVQASIPGIVRTWNDETGLQHSPSLFCLRHRCSLHLSRAKLFLYGSWTTCFSARSARSWDTPGPRWRCVSGPAAVAGALHNTLRRDVQLLRLIMVVARLTWNLLLQTKVWIVGFVVTRFVVFLFDGGFYLSVFLAASQCAEVAKVEITLDWRQMCPLLLESISWWILVASE